MEALQEYLFIDEGPGNEERKIIKRVVCSTLNQAFEKLKFCYPNTYFFILIEKGKKFKNFDDFLENRNYHKNTQNV